MSKMKIQRKLGIILGALTLSMSAFQNAKAAEKWGYIDSDGNFAIKAEYDEGLAFSEGLAAVKPSGKSLWGYIDKEGKVTIEPSFEAAGSFNGGLAPAQDSQSKLWGFIDKTGKFVVKPAFAALSPLSDGLACAKEDSKYGYVDKEGRWQINPQFDVACSFSDGKALVSNYASGIISYSSRGNVHYASGASWRYIDTKGQEVLPYQVNDCGDFKDGVAPVAIGANNGSNRPDRWGFISDKGKFVIAPKFANAQIAGEKTIAVQMGKWLNLGKGVQIFQPGKWGYISTSGKTIIKPQFDAADPFSEGLAAVKLNGKWGYIDKTGDLKIEPKFNANLEFKDGLAPVQIDVQ